MYLDLEYRFLECKAISATKTGESALGNKQMKCNCAWEDGKKVCSLKKGEARFIENNVFLNKRHLCLRENVMKRLESINERCERCHDRNDCCLHL